MSNFYQICRKLNVPERATPEQVGLLVVESVMANRIEQNRIWRTGEAKDYRMKEMNRVLSALEALSHNAVAVPLLDDLDNRYADRLSAYRDIDRICFLYDAVKFLYQRLDDKGPLRIHQTALFIGERLPGAGLRKPEGMLPYQRENESPREEYARILASMRNGLVETYKVVLQKLD
jgi:hypothetical protein